MTNKYPPLLPHKSKAWSEWINHIENLDILSEYAKQEYYANVTLLPRQDITLYGKYPKMEPRMFVICKECSKLIQYSSIKAHYHSNEIHSEQVENLTFPNAVKKKCSATKSRKKRILPKNVPPPPLFPKTTTSPSSPVIMPNELPPPILQPVQMESASPNNIAPSIIHHSASLNNHHKKLKKQINKVVKEVKEHDTEKQGEILENSKEHLVKSSSATSNHQVSVRKVIPGRNKSIDHLTVEHKISKEARRSTARRSVFTSPVPIAPKLHTEKTVMVEQTTAGTVPTTSTTKPISKICTAKVETTHAGNVSNSTTSIIQPVQYAMTPTSVRQPLSPEFASSREETVFMPMSPVAVISPVQIVQLGIPILHLPFHQQAPRPPSPAQPVIHSIPEQSNSLKMFETHPKPLIMPSMSTRKIGGAFLLHNQRVEHQRQLSKTKVSLAINCESITLLNTIHKPNILKCRSVRKNIKRSTSEKFMSNECKQARLTPDVNGFILHADVSESAEAPQSNSPIHEKNCFVK